MKKRSAARPLSPVSRPHPWFVSRNPLTGPRSVRAGPWAEVSRKSGQMLAPPASGWPGPGEPPLPQPPSANSEVTFSAKHPQTSCRRLCAPPHLAGLSTLTHSRTHSHTRACHSTTCVPALRWTRFWGAVVSPPSGGLHSGGGSGPPCPAGRVCGLRRGREGQQLPGPERRGQPRRCPPPAASLAAAAYPARGCGSGHGLGNAFPVGKHGTSVSAAGLSPPRPSLPPPAGPGLLRQGPGWARPMPPPDATPH